MKGNEFGDLTSSPQESPDGCEKCSEDAFIDGIPGLDPEKAMVDCPSWCDASFRDFYEVVISNLPVEMTKEMILQYIPSAEEKYPLLIEDDNGRKIVVLRFGPFYSLGLRNYIVAKKVFSDNAQFLKIRTHPPVIKIVGVPSEISKLQLNQEFPEACGIRIKTNAGKRTVFLEHATFEAARKCFHTLKTASPTPCQWLHDCAFAQIAERVEGIYLSDA